MELDWSAQSPHIRTLFRPWQPGDGYEEATIQAAEERLGICLPTALRNFYLAWGKRRDLTAQQDFLQHPDGLMVRAGTLIFWVENQAACFWGIQRAALKEADPPVVVAWNEEAGLVWIPSPARLSSFLDDMTYHHAFLGGAIHGGYTHSNLPLFPADQVAWLEEHWSKATVSPMVFGIIPDADWHGPPLYVRDGQAFYSLGGYCLAAREAEVVDEIGKRFQITWARRW